MTPDFIAGAPACAAIHEGVAKKLRSYTDMEGGKVQNPIAAAAAAAARVVNKRGHFYREPFLMTLTLSLDRLTEQDVVNRE